MEELKDLEFETTIAPQCIYVDEQGRIMGVTSANLGVKVITEYNCSMAHNEDGIPKYKLVDGIVTERTEEEMEADRVTPTETPSQLDRIEAQVMYTALLTDTLIEDMETEEVDTEVDTEESEVAEDVCED